MAFKGRGPTDVEFSDLLVSLLNSKLQQANFPLYQTINGLINRVQQNKIQVNQLLESFFGDITITDDVDLSSILTLLDQINNILKFTTFWTQNDETTNLPASRQVIAGAGIILDYTTAGQVEVSAVAGGAVYYTPLTDGNIDETDLIFAVGECIMVAVPI